MIVEKRNLYAEVTETAQDGPLQENSLRLGHFPPVVAGSNVVLDPYHSLQNETRR